MMNIGKHQNKISNQFLFVVHICQLQFFTRLLHLIVDNSLSPPIKLTGQVFSTVIGVIFRLCCLIATRPSIRQTPGAKYQVATFLIINWWVFRKVFLVGGNWSSFFSYLYFVLEATLRTETISSITLSVVRHFLKYGD
jgi:hypothetical protein